jgi:signal peptidase II
MRWKVLIALGLAVVLADQWTKLLAVQHLTPAFESALATTGQSREARERALASLGLVERIRLFYKSPAHPCEGGAAYCRHVPVVDGFWSFRYIENPGAAWGLLAGASESVRVPFFIAISIAAMILILAFFRRLEERQKLLIYGLSLVFGGAIGNFIDRLHQSYVIDFIDWYVGRYHWPTFNVADAAITTGVGLLLADWIVEVLRERKALRSPALLLNPQESSE